MKLKNIGTSIVSVGKTVILPDDTVDITEEGYQKNDAINFLVATNRLAIIKERTTPAKKEAQKNAAPDNKE